MSFRGTVEEHLLLCINEVYDIRQRPLTSTVPNHKTAARVLRHGQVFYTVILPITPKAWLGCMRVRRPVSDIVATRVHAIDNHVLIPAFGEVSLHRFIRAVRIADKHREILLDDIIESLFDWCV
jgi:hypothetical protein